MPRYAILLSVAAIAVWGAWFAAAGFLVSDDLAYSDAAQSWLNSFPFVGGSHWALRQTLVLPLAGIYGVFGVSEATLASVSVLFYFGLMAMVSVWLARRYSVMASGLFVVLASVAPGFATLAGTANVDVIEVFFLVASLFVFHVARECPERAGRLLFWAGVLAGLAFLSRATSIALLISYGFLFLFGWYHDRKRYFALGAGALLVYALDTLYYLIQTGNPLHRLHVLVYSHLGVGNTERAEKSLRAANPELAERMGTGNLLEGTLLEPVMAVLINNEFGLVLVAAAFLYFWAHRRGFKAPVEMKLLFGVGVIHFLVVGYLMALRPLPRYFSFSFLPALCFLAITFCYLWKNSQRDRLIAGILVLMVVGSSLVLTDLSNRNPLFTSRLILDTAKNHKGQAIYANPLVCKRAEALALFQQGGKVNGFSCASLAEADIVVYESTELVNGENPAGFKLIATVRDTETITGRAARMIGLDRMLPIPERVFLANPAVNIYRRHDNRISVSESE